MLAEFTVFAAPLFASAGTLLWLAGWAFMAFFSFSLAIVPWPAREDPELLAVRMSAPIQSATRDLAPALTWRSLATLPKEAKRGGSQRTTAG